MASRKLQLLTDIPALSLAVDPTLTKSGDAADAKVVGDKLDDKFDLDNMATTLDIEMIFLKKKV